MYRSVILLYILIYMCLSKKFDTKPSTDHNKCKLTHSGREYAGTISTTIGGVRCQSWYGEDQLHKIDVKIEDFDFPDGDRKKAKNYCRNPTSDENGPWCYTTDINLTDDECDIPLCNYRDCRISGTGAEYGGRHNLTYSGEFCLSWDKIDQFNNNQTQIFPNKKFPDKSRADAKNFCRNPTDDTGGPWCYVEKNDDYETIEKEYCDIRFCDDKDCLSFTREAANYSTITKMNYTMNNFTIWIKLWNPTDMKNIAARILLSHMPIPTSPKKIAQDWQAGAEIFLSNVGSGLLYPNFEDDLNFDYTPHILVGTKWTRLTFVLTSGTISVIIDGSVKPIFTADYGTNNSYVNSLYPDGFLYYGLLANGPGVLWSTEFCQQSCEVHTTFGIDFLRLWPIHRENINNDIQFFVRADRNIAIQLYQSPGAIFPCFTLTIGYIDIITLSYQESAESSRKYLRDLISPKLLDYFSWKEFHISIFGPHFRLFSPRHYGKSEILYARSDLLKAMRWFSVGSDNVIAHWTFYCAPETLDRIEKLSSPDCISNPNDYKYMGNQWITKYHKPCLPWSSNDVPEDEKNDNNFPDGSALKALNRCRNPTRDVEGPYCYTLETPQSSKIIKKYCEIRLCQSLECRVAGTGNDYMGGLSKTRSGRLCASWSNTEMKKLKSIHPVNPEYLNDILYPEQSVKKAKNFCRDPSRSIAGPWCYTTDPLISQDLCDVRDCEKKGYGANRRQYILPEHRINGLRIDIKAWEPDHPDGMTFGFMANDGLRSLYSLRVGGVDNDEVFLFYRAEKGIVKLVMRKTLPHLIYMGMWTNFVIKIPRGKIELYSSESKNPIFEWTHPEPLKAFVPIYYYYTSDYGHAIAVAFDCPSECTVEITETDELTRILPVTIRSTDEKLNLQKLVLIIRAKGVVMIPLLLFPETPEYYGIKLDEEHSLISFYKNTNPNITILRKEEIIPTLFYQNMWTNITLIWDTERIRLLINSTTIFHYKYLRPVLFYFFSIIVEKGSKATWTANCEPPDIDGLPEDGGWSNWGPWSCSASCNGGIGSRKRICNNPSPNIKGEPCMGPSSMTGRCNTELCGDIGGDTMKMIKQRLKKISTALSIKEGDSVIIASDTDINSRILHESPNSEINWSHNGIFMESENNRTIIKDYHIINNRAEVNDSGVYTVTVLRIDGTYMILKVVSLVVYPTKKMITRRETQSMILDCNCAVLGYLYANLQILWLLNKKIWKNYGTTLPLSVNVDNIPAINFSHHGLWECVVKQDDFNFYWTTNAIMINVIAAPNWKIHLMEDPFTKPIFGLMPNEYYAGALAIFIFISSIVAITFGTICFIKFQKRLKGGMSKYSNNFKNKNTKTDEDNSLIETDSEN